MGAIWHRDIDWEKTCRRRIERLHSTTAFQAEYSRKLEERLGYTGEVKQKSKDGLKPLAELLTTSGDNYWYIRPGDYYNGQNIKAWLGYINLQQQILTDEEKTREIITALQLLYRIEAGVLDSLRPFLKRDLSREQLATSITVEALEKEIRRAWDKKNDEAPYNRGAHESKYTFPCKLLERLAKSQRIIEGISSGKISSNIKLAKERTYSLAGNLLAAMGILEPARIGLTDEQKQTVDYDRLQQVQEMGAWILVKYPDFSSNPDPLDKTKIDIPAWIVQEEKIARENEPITGWQIQWEVYESDGSMLEMHH